MKIRNYLLFTSAIAMGAFVNQTFAQENVILDGNVRLAEGKTKTEVVEGEGNPESFDFNGGDFEEYLLINANDLYNTGLSPIPQGHLKWKSLAEESTIPEGWQPYQLCDNFTCFNMLDANNGWFVNDDYYTFQEIAGMDKSDFYTTMYFPENTTATYGEILIEVVFDDFQNVPIKDTLTFGFLNTGVAINELDPNAVSIYPNPAQNVLNVSMTNTSQIKAVALFDMNGRQMYLNNKVNSEVHAVNIENFATGTYLLRVENVKGESAIKKIQKL